MKVLLKTFLFQPKKPCPHFTAVHVSRFLALELTSYSTGAADAQQGGFALVVKQPASEAVNAGSNTTKITPPPPQAEEEYNEETPPPRRRCRWRGALLRAGLPFLSVCWSPWEGTIKCVEGRSTLRGKRKRLTTLPPTVPMVPMGGGGGVAAQSCTIISQCESASAPSVPC